MKSFYKAIKNILILALVAGGMNIVRFIITDNESYLWLNWNLFLACVPMFLAWVISNTKKSIFCVFLILLWLSFLPNAPYLVTDFIHLNKVGPESLLWYDGIMIFLYTLSGMIAWVVSVETVRLHMQWKSWYVIFIALSSSFGIYLGRYVRFNTWNVITEPRLVFQKIFDIIKEPLDYHPFIMMIVVFTIVLITLYSVGISHYEKTSR